MTREETKAILSVLKSAYPNFYKDLKPSDANQIIDLWSTMFEAEPPQIVVEAVKALICTFKFPPTIADVKEKINLITQPESLSEMEAWQMVRSAISYYNAKSNFETLPAVIQKVLGSASQLRDWAVMEADVVDSVIQSNFMRSYKVKVAQEKEKAMLPESTRQLIGGLAERMALTDGRNR